MLTAGVFLALAGSSAPAHAQQFNSDNWWVLPHGTMTGILNVGQHYSSMYLGYGFAPGFELDISVTLYRMGRDNPTKHYSTSAYVKGRIWENEAGNAGLALMAGFGETPAYYLSNGITNDFWTYWAYLPLTIPFFHNTLSWDILPGATYNLQYGDERTDAWGFLYSTRLAIYKVIPMSAIVFEAYGAAGEAHADPQYKAGVRFESKYVIVALTWGGAFNGDPGGGVELGVMLLTDPFLCVGGCK